MRNYYDILGISKNASEKEIKTAFRKQARKYHPDVNPGDKTAEERFKELSEANDVLSDKKKRKQYDRVGHDAWKAGFRDGAQSYRPEGAGGFGGFDGFEGFGGGRGYTYSTGGGDINLEDLFGNIFGGRPAGRRRRGPTKGEDSLSKLVIPMREAIKGTTYNLTLGSATARNHTLEVKIPAGVRDGQKIRLAGKGGAGIAGGPPGDLLIEISYEPDARFSREGDDITTEVKVPFAVAILGGEISVETLDGKADLKIPSGTQGGQKLRLKNKGLPKRGGQRGDLFVRVLIKVPKKLDQEGEELVEKLSKYN
jgi:curved DNA-binding protein